MVVDYTKAYEDYFKSAVQAPLQKARGAGLQQFHEQLARSGIQRSGVSGYGALNIEKQYGEQLGKQAGIMGREQALTQVNKEESARQRDYQTQMFEQQKTFQEQQAELNRRFEKDMLERKYQMQNEILQSQKSNPWMELLGGVASTAVGAMTGGIGTAALSGLSSLFKQKSSTGMDFGGSNSYTGNNRREGLMDYFKTWNQ